MVTACCPLSAVRWPPTLLPAAQGSGAHGRRVVPTTGCLGRLRRWVALTDAGDRMRGCRGPADRPTPESRSEGTTIARCLRLFAY